MEFRVKKEGWGGGGSRVVVFQRGQGDLAQLKPGGKTLAITVGDGLPKSSRHHNGAAHVSRALPNQPSNITHSSPHKHGRPPSTAPPKLGSQRTPRVQDHHQAHQGNMDFLNVPDQGMSGKQRKRSISQRPPPAPKPRPQPQGPRCRALYQYAGQDTDEISFEVNDVFELLKDDPSGWWTGRIKGKEGLFPGNYVEKI
ncbi:Unconventional myosin-If [Liparis tanakae]|uniref:Osteoclast-stimulating factor 1 n=1 Tax=Liparis tanakae TaxID=230148 RepID=A0A4Z2FHL1_9TELE|nr:Unconventional myosin-If [Liparis tanakae]